MHLLLIRHGQSLNNHLEGPAYLEHRQADPALTDLGRVQAARLATWARSDPTFGRVTHLYSSLMLRAVQTAADLSRALDLPVHGLQSAYECGGLNAGPAEAYAPVSGRDQATLSLECRDLVWPDALRGQAWDGGCEPWETGSFAARAARVNSHLREVAGEADVIALVTHHDFAQYLTTDLLNLPPQDTLSVLLRLNNTGTALIESGDPARVLHWYNRTEHLPASLRTV